MGVRLRVGNACVCFLNQPYAVGLGENGFEFKPQTELPRHYFPQVLARVWCKKVAQYAGHCSNIDITTKKLVL